MQKLHFEVIIAAPKEKVFQLMLSDRAYREWTSPFGQSRFEGSWEKGSKMLFIGTDEEGKEGGMVSRILENKSNEFISIEHYALWQNGLEVTDAANIESWAGAHEDYTFKSVTNGTQLIVSIDVVEAYKDYFNSAWPEALQKLKLLCEN